MKCCVASLSLYSYDFMVVEHLLLYWQVCHTSLTQYRCVRRCGKHATQHTSQVRAQVWQVCYTAQVRAQVWHANRDNCWVAIAQGVFVMNDRKYELTVSARMLLSTWDWCQKFDILGKIWYFKITKNTFFVKIEVCGKFFQFSSKCEITKENLYYFLILILH